MNKLITTLFWLIHYVSFVVFLPFIFLRREDEPITLFMQAGALGIAGTSFLMMAYFFFMIGKTGTMLSADTSLPLSVIKLKSLFRQVAFVSVLGMLALSAVYLIYFESYCQNLFVDSELGRLSNAAHTIMWFFLIGVQFSFSILMYCLGKIAATLEPRYREFLNEIEAQNEQLAKPT